MSAVTPHLLLQKHSVHFEAKVYFVEKRPRYYVVANLLVIGKISDYKHCFCYLNVQNVKQKVNKLTSVFNASVLLLTMYFVITLSK